MKRWMIFVLAALMLLTACHRPTETPEKPASSTTATTEGSRPLTVVGTWHILLPVDDLLDAAAHHAPTLRPLGESNVSLLRSAEPYVTPLETKATLQATLTLKENGTGTLAILQDAMKETSLTVVTEYNPLLKNIVAPVVENLLPSDISVPMRYEFTGDTLTVSAEENTDTAVVCRVEQTAMTVTGVVSRTLSESDRVALENLLKRATVTRG
ncbi:MAG: hypothetical protein IJC17_01275 [Clostridia bacterium]|nr:hypothetical protein [Clostridia bacterium]